MIKFNGFLTNSDAQVITGGQELYELWQQQDEAFLWYDISYDFCDQASMKKKLKEFGCHSLAIEDALRKRHPPKVEFFDDEIFLLYRGIHTIIGDAQFTHQQVGFFIRENILITIHPHPMMGVKFVQQHKKFRQWLQSPLNLACQIINASVAIYLEEMLKFEGSIDSVEDNLYEGDPSKALVAITSYKKHLVRLARVFSYHENMIRTLIAEIDNSPPFDFSQYRHELADVYDRTERVHSLANLSYGILSDLMDSYISVNSYHLNNAMKVLTVVTTLFVPLSFLAGLYGMNFEYIPELKYRYGYFLLLAVMAAVMIAAIVFFKKKKWF